jgi:hypothetical protein
VLGLKVPLIPIHPEKLEQPLKGSRMDGVFMKTEEVRFAGTVSGTESGDRPLGNLRYCLRYLAFKAHRRPDNKCSLEFGRFSQDINMPVMLFS